MSYQATDSAQIQLKPEAITDKPSDYSVKRLLVLMAFAVGVIVGGLAVANKESIMSSTLLSTSRTSQLSEETAYGGSTYTLSYGSSTTALSTSVTLVGGTCYTNQAAKDLVPGSVTMSASTTSSYLNFFSDTKCGIKSSTGTLLRTSTATQDSYNTNMYYKVV